MRCARCSRQCGSRPPSLALPSSLSPRSPPPPPPPPPPLALLWRTAKDRDDEQKLTRSGRRRGTRKGLRRWLTSRFRCTVMACYAVRVLTYVPAVWGTRY
eukprot:997136-Rhodomonas_salina.5